ncbi:hypothetical protein FF38_14430 [Lucilia cuprina]|uniref:Reverse transcriptase domain-containing protein n=1 Tax=Lucilia cuprina TaxID=7375 RepID=A0A0L0CGD5_LUCCU|nr:hypothetical protein FF38_14430 [Lucilia cuprina]
MANKCVNKLAVNSSPQRQDTDLFLDGGLTLTDVHARILKQETQIFTDCNVEELLGLSKDSFEESSHTEDHSSHTEKDRPHGVKDANLVLQVVVKESPRAPPRDLAYARYGIQKTLDFLAKMEQRCYLGVPSKEQQAGDGVGQVSTHKCVGPSTSATCRGVVLLLPKRSGPRNPKNLRRWGRIVQTRLAPLMSLKRGPLKELELGIISRPHQRRRSTSLDGPFRAAVIDRSDADGKISLELWQLVEGSDSMNSTPHKTGEQHTGDIGQATVISLQTNGTGVHHKEECNPPYYGYWRKIVAYEDDVVLLVNGKFLPTISEVMQSALSDLPTWANRNEFGVDPFKTELVLFTRKYKVGSFSLRKLNGVLATFLDRKLSWKKNIQKLLKKETLLVRIGFCDPKLNLHVGNLTVLPMVVLQSRAKLKF